MQYRYRYRYMFLDVFEYMYGIGSYSTVGFSRSPNMNRNHATKKNQEWQNSRPVLSSPQDFLDCLLRETCLCGFTHLQSLLCSHEVRNEEE